MKQAWIGLLIIALAGVAAARPAPWYKWRSKIDGALVCSQTPLGPGWDRAQGPFWNPQCKPR